ncbi:hypothetical protein C2E23DRAFT_727918 [Lenzites betulinus]|nr:hypothetical protein C2E23DRAFT_727918 [Lenzites betulinus]
MPSYYIQPGQQAHVHYQRPRAYSQSQAYAPQPVVYTHSGSSHHSSPQRRVTAYPQSGAYQTSPQYLTPNYQYDAGRHHHQGHARTGSGGTYYASSAPQYYDAARHSPPSSQRRSASHGRHHRAQSVPRAVQVVAPRSHTHRSSSHTRHSPPVVTHRDHRPSHPVGEPLSERIRRMFGFSHQHSSRAHNREYADARSGRTVDWRGRPIYRV